MKLKIEHEVEGIFEIDINSYEDAAVTSVALLRIDLALLRIDLALSGITVNDQWEERSQGKLDYIWNEILCGRKVAGVGQYVSFDVVILSPEQLPFNARELEVIICGLKMWVNQQGGNRLDKERATKLINRIRAAVCTL